MTNTYIDDIDNWCKLQTIFSAISGGENCISLFWCKTQTNLSYGFWFLPLSKKEYIFMLGTYLGITSEKYKK